jgi:hypothetical protein
MNFAMFHHQLTDYWLLKKDSVPEDYSFVKIQQNPYWNSSYCLNTEVLHGWSCGSTYANYHFLSCLYKNKSFSFLQVYALQENYISKAFQQQ